MVCIVTLSNVNVYIDNNTILENINLTLGPSGLYGLLGPNGSGKTTLLRTIAGILSYEGRIVICGKEPREARNIIAYVPSLPQVDPWARVIDTLLASRYGLSKGIIWSRKDLEAINNAAKITGIYRFLYRKFGELSSGEQRLVCIARALAREPRVILLDEPLAFLDVYNQYKILDLLLRISKKSTIIMSIHDLNYIHLFKTITILSKGRTVYNGPPSEVTKELLEKIYNIKLIEASLGSKRIYMPSL